MDIYEYDRKLNLIDKEINKLKKQMGGSSDANLLKKENVRNIINYLENITISNLSETQQKQLGDEISKLNQFIENL